jgi:hypothetical protein
MDATTQTSETLMDERKAALTLGVSKITLLRMRQRGAIGHYRIGSRVVYSHNHLNDFLQTCERKRKAREPYKNEVGGKN